MIHSMIPTLFRVVLFPIPKLKLGQKYRKISKLATFFLKTFRNLPTFFLLSPTPTF